MSTAVPGQGGPPRLNTETSGFPEPPPGDVTFEQDVIRTMGRNFESRGFRTLGLARTQRQEIPEPYAGTDPATHCDPMAPVPRFVAEHSASLSFPLHSYRIDKVWRAERTPNATHWRQLYRCDIDIVARGELSLLYDAEMANALVGALESVGVDGFTVRISNRKVPAALLESHGVRGHRARSAVQILDEGNRQPVEETVDRLTASGLPAHVSADLGRLVGTSAPEEARQLLRLRGADLTGIDELDEVVKAAYDLGMPDGRLAPCFSLVRGGRRYTGTVFEAFVTSREHEGALAVGGRCEDLLKHVDGGSFTGVGMSMGLSRLVELLREDGVREERGPQQDAVTVVRREGTDAATTLRVVRHLREAGLSVQPVFDPVTNAEALEIAGEAEAAHLVSVVADGEVVVHDMVSGFERWLTADAVVAGVLGA